MSAEPAGGTSDSIALVETSELLPGLLPFQSWDVLGTAEVILARDAATHPWAVHLHLAGLDLQTLSPATLERGDLDLSRPGLPDDRRMAKALVQRVAERGRVVYLLEPDEDRLAGALAGMAAEHEVEIELVFLAQQPPGSELLGVVEVLRRLRDPRSGCPWDLEQDHRSLLRYLVEETYELVDAIEHGDDADLREELGDVLLQVVFHAQVAQDRRAFGIDDVARDLTDKLVARHPHVFADGDAATADEVQTNWDRLKDEEKGREGPFDGVPAAGPGLELLTTLRRKAIKHGLEPPRDGGRLDAVLAAAHHSTEVEPGGRDRAVGALIEAVVELAVELEVDPEEAARASARARRQRTEAAVDLARRAGQDPAALDGAAWRRYWDEAGG